MGKAATHRHHESEAPHEGRARGDIVTDEGRVDLAESVSGFRHCLTKVLKDLAV